MSDGDTVQAWHAIVAARDPSGLDALLADDAVLVSPVVHTPQRGKPIVTTYLRAALHVFAGPDFRYVREIVGPSDAMLEFETTIDGIAVNGVDIVHWKADGRITEFKVMVRPLKAIHVVHERMAALLAAGRPTGS
jgi:hypothetical protein